MMPFPENKYDIIYADPAWQYNERMKDVGDVWDGGADKHYSTMSIKDLKALLVKDLASDNCLLFLWVSSPNLDECINVGKSWGFKFTTVAFVWDKGVRPVLGNYTMSQCELCLVFKHGKIPQPRGARNIHQLVQVKKGRHSVKPLQVRYRIDKMFPEQRKIELFARPGLLRYMDPTWDYWGNEV